MALVTVAESLNLPEQKGLIGRLKVGDTTVLYTRIPLDRTDVWGLIENKVTSLSVVLESADYFGIGTLYCEAGSSLCFDAIYRGFGKKPNVSNSDLPWFMKLEGYPPALLLNGSFDYFLPDGLSEGPINSGTFFEKYPDKTVFYPVIKGSRIIAYYKSVGEVAKSL